MTSVPNGDHQQSEVDASRSGPTEYLSTVAKEHGVPLKDLTVLATQNDPFRVGTEASRRDGAWLAKQCQIFLSGHLIHLRGVHYVLIGQTKPDGTEYINTDTNWEWLIGQAAKSARWNGYIGFDQIVDQKNAPPLVRLPSPPTPPRPAVSGLFIELPDVEDLVPRGVRLPTVRGPPEVSASVGLVGTAAS